ncbi:MAG: DUF3783 domain-containing protein [Candidatus Lernaella stagnicola]|nr:DUF3783 domain-containing protein [Candidatus Lernaella stagnicola]
MNDDATFQPVMKCNVRRVGPRAVLLTGFTSEEATAIGELMRRIEAPDVRVIQCAAEAIDARIQDVLTAENPGEPAPADKLPRVLLMSGLSGSEFHDLMDKFHTTEAPRPIFAAATPNNLIFTVKELLIELLKEQRAMAAMQAARQPKAAVKKKDDE